MIGECEADGVVTFRKNGTFTDSGEYGRFRATAISITYFDRVLYDQGAGTEDRSQFRKPKSNPIARLSRNAFREAGDVFVRCKQ